MTGIIKYKTDFFKGLFLLCSFAILFYFLLTPILPGEKGKRITGLEYADKIFNELSKGSSYFIPEVREEIKSLSEKNVSLSVKITDVSILPIAKTILNKITGIHINLDQERLEISGNLGKILQQATEDSDLLYYNKGGELSKKYDGLPPLRIAMAWWDILKPCINELQKQGFFSEAKVVDHVVTRALEPGNNFYGIMPAKMSEHVFLVSALLIFYVVYTLWYGFGIYELFEGFGLVMHKSKE